MCDYCEENKTLLERQEPLMQTSIENAHIVIIDMYGIQDSKINFCPMCGKKLEKQVIRFGFRSKNQMPLFMIWREYWQCKEMVFAEVLFSIG